jgi:hypothetical protein
MPALSIPIRRRRRAIIPLRMAADHGRRIAVVLLVTLLAALPPATLLPGSPGSVRVAGMPLLSWYAFLIAPVVAAGTVVLSRLGR